MLFTRPITRTGVGTSVPLSAPPPAPPAKPSSPPRRVWWSTWCPPTRPAPTCSRRRSGPTAPCPGAGRTPGRGRTGPAHSARSTWYSGWSRSHPGILDSTSLARCNLGNSCLEKGVCQFYQLFLYIFTISIHPVYRPLNKHPV